LRSKFTVSDRLSNLLFFALAIILALSFRAPELERRPIHHDEANQADKFGALLEKGEYRYDPTEHHGPTLYYLTLPIAWISGVKNFRGFDAKLLRFLPVIFGLFCLFILWLLKDGLGKAGFPWGLYSFSLSPVLIYFSRFYIQETLLVFFSLGVLAGLWRYLNKPSIVWALFTGLFTGFALATKETWIIGFFAVIFACFFSFRDTINQIPRRVFLKHTIFLLVPAALPWLIFYSSFFTNWEGLSNSLEAYGYYFARGTGTSLHNRPWYHYIHLLFSSWPGAGSKFGTYFLGLSAFLGLLFSLRQGGQRNLLERFTRLAALNCMFTVVIYSAIPHKTPWLLASPVLGIILLSSAGIENLFQNLDKRRSKIISGLVLFAALLSLGFESYKTNFVYETNPKNPLVYSQTTKDFVRMTERIKSLIKLKPESLHLIAVVMSHLKYWPLPWYFRGRGNFRIGYSTHDDYKIQGLTPPPDFLITDAHLNEEELEDLSQGHWVQKTYTLRPGLLIHLYVKQSIWERSPTN